MFKLNLKIALRNIWKYKTTNLIKLTGLIIGLTAVILLTAYLNFELSYDKSNTNFSRLFRIEYLYKPEGIISSKTPSGLSVLLNEEIPEIEQNVSLHIFDGKILDKDVSYTVKVASTQSQFFNIFGIPLDEGDYEGVLSEPNTVVMSKALASKLFRNHSALGKTIQLYGFKDVLRIVGVMNDIPQNTHFQADVVIGGKTDGIVSFEGFSGLTQYILLKKETSIQTIQAKLKGIAKKYEFGDDIEINFLQVSKIHLYGHSKDELSINSDIKYIYIFSIATFLILFIALINFVNLTVAASLKRAKEIGVKKVLGASRSQLKVQFLSESYIYFLTAAFVSIILSFDILPIFSLKLGVDINIKSLLNYKVVPLGLGIILLSGFIAGFYPAMILSKFHPVKTLKGNLQETLGGLGIRKGLMIFQFSISALLIISTIIILGQLNFMRNKKLGFDKDHVLYASRSDFGVRYASFKNELLRNQEIQSISLSSFDIGNRFGGMSKWTDPIDTTKSYTCDFITSDLDFFKTLDIELAEGRLFSSTYASDLVNIPFSPALGQSREAFDALKLTTPLILNESAVKEFGIKDPINQTLDMPGLKGKVIGVVKDFNGMSLHDKVNPVVLKLNSHVENGYTYIKVRSNDIQHVKRVISETWKKYSINPVPEFEFLSQNLEKLYLAEMRLGNLFVAFSITAIILCCIGLFGVIYFELERKTKEIAIRKILGASLKSLLSMLNSGFIKIVLIANVLMWPIAYILLKDWLNDFYYRREISYLPFLLTLVVCILITILTVSIKAFNTVKKSPVDALKYE